MGDWQSYFATPSPSEDYLKQLVEAAGRREALLIAQNAILKKLLDLRTGTQPEAASVQQSVSQIRDWTEILVDLAFLATESDEAL
ncbi:unnamed protein product [Clonostachys rhizophaga]|uniref:Uncharacterized protein n=1 Tax=Clonostachys rhizophaga TaxID=160324 RepID=A0A9N9VD05_9HYPO|nr:unnamed protein product [Clonostachys rhizophaga]